jgi:hypothetical protein
MATYAGPSSTELTPDDDCIHRFLTWWFRHCNRGFIEVGWTDPATGRLNLFRRFDLNDKAEAANFAATTNATPGANIYLRAATVRPETQFTRDDDIVQIPGAWADGDRVDSVALGSKFTLKPSAHVRTGLVPTERGQFWWQYSEPILIQAWSRNLNSAVQVLIEGDPAVINPSSLMRLPGTIAWPYKPNRVPELTEWINGTSYGYSITACLNAFGTTLSSDQPAERPTAAQSTSELLNPVQALLNEIARGPSWHDPVLRLVATLVSRGTLPAVIIAMAPALTKPGYTVAQTQGELTKMIEGAYRKGYAPGDGCGDSASDDDVADVMDCPPKAAPDPTPEIIDGDWWIARELTRPVPVLGEVICASTRALIGGPTGAGKTHLAMGMAGAIATGRGFLHLPGPAHSLLVLYIDGEMARDLIQDRMRDLQRRLGGVSLANLHMLCREDFPAMQGLNTPPGRTFVLDAVEHLKPSVIFLDSRMCLLVGDMKDEIPWTETMPLVWALTRLQVAQIWLDHTGHDGGHIYGSKTKEWQMDLVGLVEEANDPSADIAIKLRWTKARRRRPETRADFSPGIITLRGDEWLWTPDEAGVADKGAKRGRGMSDETELLRRAISTLAYDPSVQPTFVPETSFPVRAVGVVTTIAYLITNGWFIERVDYGEEIIGGINTLTRRGRDRLRNSLNTLKRHGICGFNRDFVWPAK